MNLDQIQLPASVVAQLYRRSLVDDASSAEISLKKPATPPDPWKYLGENKKNILIVVDYPGIPFIPDEELSFLTGMLTACQLNLGDVAIVNRHNTGDSDYRSFAAQFSSRIVFLFGVEPSSFGIPMSFPHFQVQSFNKTTFLYVPPLEERNKDQLYKSKLWVSLRRIFGI